MSRPYFFQTPIKYLRWSVRERPQYFWAYFVFTLGPIAAFVIPPIRYRLGDMDAPPVPLTYPIPSGPRKVLTGYDDPKPKAEPGAS